MVTQPLLSRYPARMPDYQSSPGPRELLGASTDVASSPVTALRQAMAADRITATALASNYLDRISDVNPALRAVIAVSPDALDQAAASDAAWRAGQPRGPLEGIPVLVKDNIQVAGLPATAGSPALLGARPPDAFIVSRLRAAGAVILAKANLSEWANFRSTRSTSGWSTLGGQTANPYALDRNPSGSSSGSAAGAVGGLRAPRGRHGDGRVDRLTVERLRRGRHQADTWPGQPGRHRAVVAGAGHARARWPPRSRTRRRCCPCSPPPTPTTARPIIRATPSTTPRSSTPRRLTGRGSASGGRRPRARTPSPRHCSTWRWTACASSAPAVIDPVDLPDIDKVTEPEFDALNYEFKHGINAYLKYLAGVRRRLRPGAAGDAGRPDRLQRAERRPGPRPVRPGDLPGRGGDQR